MDSAILPPPCACRLQSSGSNRRSGVAYGAFPVVLLAACCSPWRARRRKPRAIRHHLGTAETCHIVEVGSDWSDGRLVAASREKDRMKAAADPRGMQGYAVGR